ncbi:MAG TPA: lysoplasmalogenase [Hyphomonadaceae bacterium]|nr:lysoplasmalogenase [Hyphomonadaceae bacterium]
MTGTFSRTSASSLFFLLAALVALSHLANDWIDLAPPWGLVWKASGIVLLGIYALWQRAWLVGIALLLCATGDVLLELVFVAGMAAFALGHVVYILCFVEWGRVLGLNKRDYPMAGLVVIVSLALLAWFFPGMGSLTIPALIYQAVITTMVASALVVKAPMLARLGAVVFMLSDTLIAVGKFAGVAPPTGSVWLTYAAAQIMIAWGLSRIAPYRDRALNQPVAA